jgi:hypothetical protein
LASNHRQVDANEPVIAQHAFKNVELIVETAVAICSLAVTLPFSRRIE